MDLPQSKNDKMNMPFKMLRGLVRLFSQPGDELDRGHPRLITIPYSHYVDRARWALDLSPWAATYTEDGHPPGFHMFAVHQVTAGQKSATPVLVIPPASSKAGKLIVVDDSFRILRHLAEVYPEEMGWLYPPELADEIIELEQEMALVFGAYSRQLAYTHLLSEENLSEFVPIFSRHSSWIEAILFGVPAVHKLIAKVMKRMMRCRHDRDDQAINALNTLCNKLAPRLEPPRKYLAGNGDKFTAADLTMAALCYPFVFPKCMEDVMAPFENLPGELQSQVAPFRSTKVGQHTLRMYAEHRFPPGLGRKTLVKRNPRRDRVPVLELACFVAAVAVLTLLWLS